MNVNIRFGACRGAFWQGCCPWPWSLVVLKDKTGVLGLGLERLVLGPGLGLEPSVLGPDLALEA